MTDKHAAERAGGSLARFGALWDIVEGEDCVVAIALHDGHVARKEVSASFAIGPAERRREEDPGTGRWTEIAATRLVHHRSRFEYDVNRTRELAVYLRPQDAWGLRVYEPPLPPDVVARSLAYYDAFYADARVLIERLLDSHETIVILDLHSYNHRRGGPDVEPADVAENPEVNVGTASIDRTRFGPLIDRFIDELSAHDFLGRRLDVRENVRFFGGNFSRWSHSTFPGRVCTLAVEFKKFFMDEWSGEFDEDAYSEIPRALESTLAGLRAELAALPRSRRAGVV